MTAVGTRAPRVAIFTDTFAPQVNGVARTLDRLAEALRERGGSATVVTVDMPASEAEALPEDRDVVRWPAVPFWAYPELRIAAPRVREARRLLRALKPDVVHVATPFGIGLAARAAALAEGIPLVSSYHTDFSSYLSHYGLQALSGVAWPYLRWFHNSAHRTFVPTEIGAEALRAQGFQRLRVWARGVDLIRFSPRYRSQALRTAMGVGERDILLVSVGRLAAEKGVDTILAAAARLVATGGPKVRVAFAGDGPAESRYRASAPPGTVFAGRLTGDALSEFYASADGFIFASTTDTFGNVLLEAMASGLPIIAPDAGATTEVAHAGNAMLVPAHDPAALASAMQRLASDASLRQTMREQALECAASRDWGRVWDGLFAEYALVYGPSFGATSSRCAD
ncbi:MAG: glycosyltransferase family 1 protein [Gemmatimonadetes bacterium]|nr:glycosyltransferase family 1 protein [Gemmatimonadota bacterium]